MKYNLFVDAWEIKKQLRLSSDSRISHYLFTKAAEQGGDNSSSTVAQYVLGGKYYDGIGIEQDYKKAALWYTKAAERGFADAQYKLGLMYEEGLGVEQDYNQASLWYNKSAEQGYTAAQLQLSLMYENRQKQ